MRVPDVWQLLQLPSVTVVGIETVLGHLLTLTLTGNAKAFVAQKLPSPEVTVFVTTPSLSVIVTVAPETPVVLVAPV
jgi:hypothetical protein